MLTYEEAGAVLDEVADMFPEEFYKDLNGSILFLPEVKRPREAPDLYIMGTYCRNQMGRYIEIYYGSFAGMAEAECGSRERWKRQLYKTVSHEFTHHWESLAGERALEDKDAEYMARYWARKARENGE